MTYKGLVRISGSTIAAYDNAAKAAAVFYRSQIREHLLSDPAFPRALLATPQRVLKRWVTRAAKDAFPRSRLLTGPERTARHTRAVYPTRTRSLRT